MPRPRRILLSAATTLSLLLFITTLALWLRSHTVVDELTWRRTDGARQVRSAPNHLVLSFDLSDWSHQPPDFYGLQYTRKPDARTIGPAADELVRILVLSVSPRDTFEHWKHAGVTWLRWRDAARQNSMACLILPFWPLGTIFALLPATRLLLHHRARRRRRTPGLCPACGYDLRATPTRCPECGTIPS